MKAAHRNQLSLMPAWLIPPFLLGATLALAGGFWDDAWHTERGRDSFFIAPHIAVYSGVTLAAGALAAWLLLAIRERGLRSALSYRPLTLAALGVAVTLSSAPIDNFWHLAFGRDAVIWSPPHVLGIVGMAGLSVALLVELQRSGERWARPLRWVVGALLLAAFSFLVVEYDTDVPQFPVLWYLPVLTLVSSLALALIRRATGERFAASRAGAVHLLYFAAVTLFLVWQGFDTPKAPLIIFAALVLDLSAARRAPLAAQAVLFAAAVYLAYVPALALLGHGVRLSAGDVAIGLPLSVLAAFAGLALVFAPRPRLGGARQVALTSSLTIALLLLLAVPAFAHDPGEGSPAGSFDFTGRVRGDTLTLSARREPGDCETLAPQELLGRRAGDVAHGKLTRNGCTFTGTVALPSEGRWFVYLDARKEGETLESWIPVKVGEGQGRVVAADRFGYIADRKPATALKWALGAAMYALVIAFLVGMVALVRSAAPAAPRTADPRS